MKPNVVLVLVDDMGYGDFGVFSEGACRTPVLDGLVKDGVCLTQHYSGSCVCAPSRGGAIDGQVSPSHRCNRYSGGVRAGSTGAE